jgi:hypothetical protein
MDQQLYRYVGVKIKQSKKILQELCKFVYKLYSTCVCYK